MTSSVSDAGCHPRRGKLLFLVNADWYFWSHRLPLARAARDAGYDVIVVTQVAEHGSRIEGEGFQLIPVLFPRAAKNPVADLRLLMRLRAIYREERPTLVHHVSLKPVVLGSLALGRAPGTFVVNALTGLGHTFTSDRLRVRALRSAVRPLLEYALNRPHSRVVLQNTDDAALLQREGIVDVQKVAIIPGSGVDPEQYRPPVPRPRQDPPLVVLASRMLWDKGVGEFVAAAEILRDRGVPVRLALVGGIDEGNPSAVSAPDIERWVAKGILEWWGLRTDMREVLASSDIVCLPSYREGLPKVLIEAASCERAMVATDVPGCRDIVVHGETGLLVPVRDSLALADALARLLADEALCDSMGKNARQRVLKQFSLATVIDQTMAVYDAPFLRTIENVSDA